MEGGYGDTGISNFASVISTRISYFSCNLLSRAVRRKKLLGIGSWKTFLFPQGRRTEGTQKREIPKSMALNHTCPILLSGCCSVPVLSAHLKVWSAARYNILINKKKGLRYSSFTPACLIWNSNNVVISLREVYFKVADIFSNDRPRTYFL